MKVFLLAILGLGLGVLIGGILGAMIGFAWAGLQTDCADGSCGLIVFITAPVGMLIGGLAGAWWLGRKGLRSPAAAD